MVPTPLKVAAVAAACVFSLTAAAHADVEFAQRGAVGYVTSHRLQPGDDEAFREFLDQPRSQPLRIIYLNSRGGNPRVAMAMGHMIRERGLDTGFHAGQGGDRNRCVSACTVVFLGGVHRYYVGGAGIRDGANTRVGLGFHPPRRPEPGAEEEMNDYFREMGASGATALRYHIYPPDRFDEPFEGVGPRGARMMWFTGSRTAIRSGVATGDRPPPGLRD